MGRELLGRKSGRNATRGTKSEEKPHRWVSRVENSILHLTPAVTIIDVSDAVGFGGQEGF
jgi:hypothetical protein